MTFSLWSVVKDKESWNNASDQDIESVKAIIRNLLKLPPDELIKVKPLYGAWFMVPGYSMVDLDVWTNDLSKRLGMFSVDNMNRIGYTGPCSSSSSSSESFSRDSTD